MKSKGKAFKIWKKQSNKKLKKKKFSPKNSNITTETNVVAPKKAQTLTEIFGNLKEVCTHLAVRVQYCVENKRNFEEEEPEEDTDDEEEEEDENEGDEKKNEFAELLDILEIRNRKKVDQKMIMKEVLKKCDDILNLKNIGSDEENAESTGKSKENKTENGEDVNKNEPMSFDLRSLSGNTPQQKLEEFLGCKKLSFLVDKDQVEDWNEDEAEELEELFLRRTVLLATNEGDILKVLKKSAPKSIALKLLQKKFEIRWSTVSGEPDDFDFYSLPAHFIKGSVRKAHVQTVLWSRRRAIESFNPDDNPGGFCPQFLYHKHSPYRKEGEGDDSQLPVRMRNEPHYVWKKWSFNNSESNQSTQLEGEQLPQELSWISPMVRLLIRKLCAPIDRGFSPDASENVMYMLVMLDSRMHSASEPSQPGEKGFKSQVYIGSAEDGLKEKFLGEGGFCEKMASIKKHFSSAEFFAFHPTALLVEMRLMQALAAGEKFALFVLNTFEDPRQLAKEAQELVGQALFLKENELWGPATDAHFGLNLKDEMKGRKNSLPNSFPGKRRKKRSY